MKNEYIPSSLTKEIESNKELYPFFEMTFQGIKPKNNCGFLKIQNENYFIVPKIADKEQTNLHIFIYMLMYAFDVKLTNRDF